jgi:hypothetical protein
VGLAEGIEYGRPWNGGSESSDLRDWCNRINKYMSDEIQDCVFNTHKYVANSLSNAPPVVEPWCTYGGYRFPMPGSAVLQYGTHFSKIIVGFDKILSITVLGMGFLPDSSVNPSAIYAGYLNGKMACYRPRPRAAASNKVRF